jgi:hypothetical protein
MIAPANPHPPKWHAAFLLMLPTIQRYARAVLRPLPAEVREDAIAEVIANTCCAYARLVERGKEHVARPTVLTMYAIRQYFDGRRVGNKACVRDAYNQHAQARGAFRLKHIGSPRDQRGGGWREQLVENSRTPVPDQVAFRCDFPSWLSTLSKRDRRLVQDLAAGERTGVVARKFGVSASRVSQLRGELKASWEEFVGDDDTVE